MTIATDMRKLGEEIIASYDMRVKAVGELVKDTHTMLDGFHSDHEQMSAALKQDLARGEDDRLKDFGAMMRDIQRFVGDLTKAVSKMIKSFHAEHKEMADALRADLAKGEEHRLKDFKTMMSDIEKFVADVTKTVNEMLKRFQQEHKAMADELKASLERGETDRLKDFEGMMAGIHKAIKEIETFVANKLKEFDDAHADMSEKLKKDLAKYVSGIVSETKKLLAGFEAESKKMAANWQKLTETMFKRRGGKIPKVRVEAAEEVKTVEEAVAGKGKKKPARKSKSSKQTVPVGV